MGLITQNFGVNETQRYNVAGRYLSVRGGSNLTLRLIRNNAYLSDIFAGVNAGFQYDGGDNGSEWFDAFEVTSPTAQALSIFSSLARVSDAGAISVLSMPIDNGTATNTRLTTYAGSIQVLPANPLRKSLILQNMDAAVDMMFRFDGGAASASWGVKVSPGQTLVLDKACPTGQVNVWSAITSAGNALQIVEVE